MHHHHPNDHHHAATTVLIGIAAAAVGIFVGRHQQAEGEKRRASFRRGFLSRGLEDQRELHHGIHTKTSER